VPYTLADRERLVRLEEKMSALEKRIDQLEKHIDRIAARLDRLEERFDRLEARIGAVNNPFSQLTYLLFGSMGLIVGLMGFILWDRPKARKPLERKIKALPEDTESLPVLSPLPENIPAYTPAWERFYGSMGCYKASFV
jgi:uncharacterized coiled-coil protein SlyX